MKKRLVPKRTFQHFFYGIRFFCNNIFIFVSFTRLITDPDTKRTDNAEKCKTYGPSLSAAADNRL